DVDAYIHQSGRTGRAGRNGTCVMLYKPNQEFMINQVERRARISVQRVGAPQSSDIVKASDDDTIKSVYFSIP
uniref:RNA helicase n=1 Tax=Amphimedon queenslandica TaxID=400682 RepID=A0A1X7SDE5_AMPQE